MWLSEPACQRISSVEFRIADMFTDSLARLTAEEQKALKTTAFDLQINAAQPAMRFHRVDHAKDSNFWSVRVNKDVRLIVHRSGESLLLCYVNHHDEAYRWAERRKLEMHPKTGAAQVVEIRETVQEIRIPKHVEAKQLLFADVTDDQLLDYGVPLEWLADARKADEDSIFRIAAHLPAEAVDALLDIATGSPPPPPRPSNQTGNPFEHPDAQSRFRQVNSSDDLEHALKPTSLQSYFEKADLQRAALDAFFDAWGGEWSLGAQLLEPYVASQKAFEPSTNPDDALRFFEVIYDELKGPNWQVFRSPLVSARHWSSEEIFATLKREFGEFSRRGDTNLLNFSLSKMGQGLLVSLEKMREIKQKSGYPTWLSRSSCTSTIRLCS